MIDVSPYQLELIEKMLQKHVPDCEVRAFGSRVTWTAKDYSDLDLAIVGKEKLAAKILHALKDDFKESDLPFRVDALDWSAISKEFRKVIEKKYEVIQKAGGLSGKNIIPEGWDLAVLKNVAEVNEAAIGREYPFDEIEYIDIASVDKGRVLEIQKLLRKEAPSRAQRIVRDNDILLSTVRPNLKHFAFIAKSKLNLIASTGFAVISANKINPEYLYYYLTTDQYTNFLTAIADAHTSTYPAFNPDVLENSEISVPSDPNEQRAIAKILSDLDAKIELNHQMNKTLESIAQVIFKKWFVDFEFPGYEKVKFVNGLPEGWKVGKLSEMATIVGGGTPATQNHSYFCTSGTEIAWITPKDLSGYQYKFISHGETDITEEGLKNSSAKIMPENTILMSSRAPIGYLAITANNITTNQGFKSLIPKQIIALDFLFYWLKQNIGFIQSIASGSTFKEVSGSVMKDLELAMPSEDLLLKFDQFMSPINSKLKEIFQETRNLTQIRDSLLPRLMSGKIRVKVKA